jgi:hypothetical protein
MLNYKDKECKGCIFSEIVCSFETYNAEYKCPCKQCLVKVMCKSECDARALVLFDVLGIDSSNGIYEGWSEFYRKVRETNVK